MQGTTTEARTSVSGLPSSRLRPGDGSSAGSDSSASASSSSWCSSSQAISTLPGATRTSSPVSAARPARIRAASAGSTGVFVRGFVRAPDQRAARSAARTDMPWATILRASLRRLGLVRDGEHGAGVALRELAALDHREHVVGELEQPQLVRDRGLRAADPLGDLAERELELVDQQRVAARLLDRREILAGDVLDEADQERLAVVGLADHGGHASARPPRGPPASAARRRSARSRPRAAAGARPAARSPVADRVGQPGGRLVIEALARLARVRVDLLDRDVRELDTAGAADQDLEAAAEAPPRCFSCVRQAPSPPSSRPRRHASAGRSG